MNGMLTSVSIALESSIFAFSAASSRRWRASASVRTSMPLSFLNSSASQLMIFWSMSLPPSGVAVGRLHLDDVIAHFEHGDVEGAAAEVEDGDLLVLLLIESVGERGGGRLVDDALHVEAGDLACGLGRLSAGRR
jgi:hypothetical protein